MEYVHFNNARIAFSDAGHGRCIVLVHGFPESSKIWKKFDEALNLSFRIIMIDLPGFGKSEAIAEIHSMDLLADAVHEVLKARNVRQCLMVGHSMGGYVALEFARKYPEMLRAVSLFHSHPFGDTAKGKAERERAIRKMLEDPESYIRQFIPSLFAPEFRRKHESAIGKMVTQALKIPPESLAAAMRGMKLRRDSTALVKSLGIPVQFIVGMKDTRAPVGRIEEMLLLPKHSESLILQEIGHMGFLEDYSTTLQAVWCFAKRVL